MTCAARAADAPYFAFEGELRPVPDEPTHCRGRGCKAELEPLRRWGGLCAKCIRKRGHAAARPVLEEPHFVLIAEYERKSPKSGKRERYVRVQCTCGRKRRMKRVTWQRHRPACCSRCRLRAANMRGFGTAYCARLS